MLDNIVWKSLILFEIASITTPATCNAEYVLEEKALTYMEAEQTCSQNRGQLPHLSDIKMIANLTMFLSEAHLNSTWIGPMLHNDYGCYKLRMNEMKRRFVHKSSPDTCVTHCNYQGHAFAAVQRIKNASRTHPVNCSCVDSLWTNVSLQDDLCSQSCTPERKKCGHPYHRSYRLLATGNCMVLHQDGLLQKSDCNASQSFICETEQGNLLRPDVMAELTTSMQATDTSQRTTGSTTGMVIGAVCLAVVTGIIVYLYTRRNKLLSNQDCTTVTGEQDRYVTDDKSTIYQDPMELSDTYMTISSIDANWNGEISLPINHDTEKTTLERMGVEAEAYSPGALALVDNDLYGSTQAFSEAERLRDNAVYSLEGNDTAESIATDKTGQSGVESGTYSVGDEQNEDDDGGDDKDESGDNDCRG